MAETTVTEQHKTFFGRLIAAIGGFFGHLLKGAETGFNDLSKQQQDDIVNGVNISQILKEGYKDGKNAVLTTIETKLNIPPDVAEQLLLTALKDVNINEPDLKAGFGKLADRIQAGVTDNHWNDLWKTIAKSAAQWLSQGSLSWISLGMGLVEWALQHFLKATVS
jgi:hypothetical protein